MMLFVGLLLEWTREWILGSLVATPSGTSWANLGGFVGQANFDRLFKQCLKIEDTHGYPQIAILWAIIHQNMVYPIFRQTQLNNTPHEDFGYTLPQQAQMFIDQILP